MNDYIEYTLLLIGIPSYILSRLSLYHLHIGIATIKGALFHFVFFTLYAAIIASYVFFIRQLR